MSHATAHGAHEHGATGRASVHASLLGENVTAPGAARGLGSAMLVAGLVGLGATAAGGMGDGRLLHAIAAYHVGATLALSMCLGCMFLVMVWHLTNAGWASTIRRQCENVMSLTPLCALMVLAGFAIDTIAGKSHDTQLWSWMHDSQAHNFLLHEKSGFLNRGFFIARAAIYLGVWTLLSRSLLAYSLKQDRAPDVAAAARARWMSAWGMLAFALTTAFAGFDWLMSLDFTFFSTMWGVYFFAGSAYAGVALTVLLFAWLRSKGKLAGVVTREHFHDLGKLQLAFTVFWAYIAFSQYFLIWYGNIPEETAFFAARLPGPREPGGPEVPNSWLYVGALLCVSHFALPFVILLFRSVKQRYGMLATMAVWSLLAHLIDIFWIVRPTAYAGNTTDPMGLGGLWIDVAALVGVLGVFGFLVMRKVTSGPLVAVNDPWINEAMEHKNYV
jgi:hypothetical protein